MKGKTCMKFWAVCAMVLLLAALPLLGACAREVVKEVPVERVVEKEVVKEVPVERIVQKEVVKEVPVEKVVVKEVPATRPSQPVLMRLADYSPATGVRYEGVVKFADQVTKGTNGRVTFELYYAETLVKQAEIIHAVKSGVVDIGYFASGKHPSELPNWTIFPTFVTFPEMAKQDALYDKLRAEIPELDQDIAKMNQQIVVVEHLPPLGLMARDRVNTVWELKGKTIRSASLSQKALVEAVGASSVNVPNPDIYSALQTGTIDGATTHIENAHRSKWQEVGKTYFHFPEIWLGNEGLFTVNLDTFNKMSDADQRVFTDAAKQLSKYLVDERIKAIDSVIVPDLKKAVNFVVVSLDDEMKMAADPKVAGMADEWVKKSPHRPAIMQKMRAIVGEFLK